MHRPRKARTGRLTQAKPLPAEHLNRSEPPPATDQVREDEQEAALIGNAGEPILPLPLVVRAEGTAKLEGVGDLSEQPKSPRGSVSTSGKAAT
jgi:hypothetical protein